MKEIVPMPTVEVPAQLSVEHLMAAIKQLSPAEWQEFQRQFTEWQAQNGVAEETETQLLARIRENSSLPASDQERLNRLRRAQQGGVLTPSEQVEYQALWQRVEQMTVARLKALTQLASRRNTDVRALTAELGIPEPGVF
jgi:hypothetical protein